MNKILVLLYMGILSFLFGNRSVDDAAQQGGNVALEEITSRVDKAEGWNDIFLKITSETVTDSSYIYIAKGLHNKEVVGLQIEISTHIGAGVINGKADQSGFAADAVRIKTIGKESDRFINALAELYKQPTGRIFISAPISVAVFSLNDKNVDLSKSAYYKLKLFFAGHDKDMYCELFLNINTTKREIELHEKDEGYRPNIIKCLTNR